MTSLATHMICSRCDARHDLGVEQHACTSCGGPLLVEYDLDAVRRTVDREAVAARPETMWRYTELLPLGDGASPVSLGEGFTPLVPAPELGRRLGVPRLWVKDEAANPTGTFKARGASSGISLARELGVSEVAVPSLGNAGVAWAAYGAVAGIGVHVTLPTSAPALCRDEAEAYGADVEIAGETLPEAAAISAKRASAEGWYNAATWREPYRVDGKRTLGLEIAEQLGWTLPDAVVYPTGGGIGVVAIDRAFAQLRELGWVEGATPKMIAVQAEGCAPVVAALNAGTEDVEPWGEVRTVAVGIGVPAAPGHRLVLEALRRTGGTAVAVSDADMLEAMTMTAASTGILPCPEGAAAIAALPALIARGDLGSDDRVVVVSTGAGMRYPDAVAAASARAGELS